MPINSCLLFSCTDSIQIVELNLSYEPAVHVDWPCGAIRSDITVIFDISEFFLSIFGIIVESSGESED